MFCPGNAGMALVVWLLVPSGGLAAQASHPSSLLQAPTCGWDLAMSPSSRPGELIGNPRTRSAEPATPPLPAIVGQIETRLGEVAGRYEQETAREGLAEFEKWVRQCDGSASHQAVLELRRAWQRTPSNPTLKAALGLALVRGIEVQPPGARGWNFRPAYQLSNAEMEGRRLLSQALEKWPVPELGEELAALAIATRNKTTLEMAAAALRKLTDTLPEAAGAWTARAEVALARREYQEAIEAGGKAAELRDPSGFRALGVAHLLHDADPEEGGHMYLVGLADADAGAIDRYHEDLAPLLLIEEEQEWAGVTGLEQQRAWLRDKWEWRASTAGRTVAERLAVHFRRLETVMDAYLRLAHRGAKPSEALVWDSLYVRFPYDDRGLLYVRHGQPDDIIRAPATRNNLAREAWVYRGLNDGRGVFYLQKEPDWADYVLEPPPTCDPFVYMYGVGGLRGQAIYERGTLPSPGWHADFLNGLEYALRLAVYQPGLQGDAQRCREAVENPPPPVSRTAISQRHVRSAGGAEDALPAPGLLDELRSFRLTEAARRMDARQEVAEALHTETALPRFSDAIQALSSVYAFRGPGGQDDVAAFLLLPTGQLTPRPLEQGVAYPLKLSLALEDPVAEKVQRLDTLMAFAAPQALQPGLYLRTALQMKAEPVLSATVRITVRNPDHPGEGQILVGVKTIPAFPAAGLAMSDLVIGEPVAAGTWHRGKVSISPLPGHQVAAAGKFRLFYEVYGLKRDESIRTRITIAPTTDANLLSQLKALLGKKQVMELSFEESAQPGPDGVLQVERTITPTLDAGRYTLEVRVERGTGETAKAETTLRLLEKK